MEYTVTQISPVKTSVNVNVGVEEVGAALATAITLYRDRADIKGFRKGKVPGSLIESRFKKEIVSEATNDLINVHINEIMAELKLTPMSRIDVNSGQLAKGEPFAYSFDFEHAPAFDLPNYIGLAAEEEDVVISDAEIDTVIERIRGNLAEVKPTSESRPAVDGEVVSVTFEAFENGQSVPGVRAENFEMTIGQGQALPDFEALVKTVPAGGEGEGEMTFPADFINASLAGKTVTMKVAVHVIKEKKLPAVDDELAKKAGNFESLAAMRQAIGKSYQKSRADLNRSSAQKKLLDGLLAGLDFPLPPSIVEQNLEHMVEDYVTRLERHGKGLVAMGKTRDDVKAELTPKAEELVKTQIFLLSVAAKESLEVTPQEMDAYFYRLSTQTGQDVILLKRYYEDQNMMVTVRDTLLADKAMDLIYSKAEVTKVPPAEAKAAPEAAEAAPEA